MALYHVSYKNYDIGETISPGDWGNTIKSLDSSKCIAWLDLYLENIRPALNPIAISRLNCIYAFNNSTNAENFALSRNDVKIYEIHVPYGTPTSLHNFKVISYFGGLLNHLPTALLHENKNLLDLYWIGDDSANWADNYGNNIDYLQEELIGGQATITRIF